MYGSMLQNALGGNGRWEDRKHMEMPSVVGQQCRESAKLRHIHIWNKANGECFTRTDRINSVSTYSTIKNTLTFKNSELLQIISSRRRKIQKKCKTGNNNNDKMEPDLIPEIEMPLFYTGQKPCNVYAKVRFCVHTPSTPIGFSRDQV